MHNDTHIDEEPMNINADADIPGSTHLNNPLPEEENTDETGGLNAQLEEQKDKYLRLLADFENYKRRSAKERLEYLQTAGKDVIVPLLDVLDDMDRAEKQINSSTDVNQIREGVGLVFNKLRSVLQQRGLKAVESVGNDFDVESHEAITQIDSGKDSAGKVLDEVQKGYTLNDKLIRFAKVVVGK